MLTALTGFGFCTGSKSGTFISVFNKPELCIVICAKNTAWALTSILKPSLCVSDTLVQGIDFLSMLYDTDLCQIYTFLIKIMAFSHITCDVCIVKLFQVFSSLYHYTHPKDSFRTCLFQNLYIQLSFNVGTHDGTSPCD